MKSKLVCRVNVFIHPKDAFSSTSSPPAGGGEERRSLYSRSEVSSAIASASNLLGFMPSSPACFQEFTSSGSAHSKQECVAFSGSEN